MNPAWQPGDIDYYNPWSPCGDYASDPNQLLSSSAGGPPPGCPGGGPLDPPAYHVRILFLPACHSVFCPAQLRGEHRVSCSLKFANLNTPECSPGSSIEFCVHTRSFLPTTTEMICVYLFFHARAQHYGMALVTAVFVVLTVLGVAELGRYFRVNQTHARPVTSETFQTAPSIVKASDDVPKPACWRAVESSRWTSFSRLSSYEIAANAACAHLVTMIRTRGSLMSFFVTYIRI